MMSVIRYLLLTLLWLFICRVSAQPADVPTGTQIMQEVQRRYQLQTNIYEELTVILTDRLGNRDTRNMRRYSRTDVAGNTKFLLMFDTPVDVHGVALLANRDSAGQTSVMIYLPATGRQEMQQIDPGPDGNIISTDFSLEQMIGEQPQQYQYVLAGQQKTSNINYYLVDVYAADSNVASNRPTRRHYVRQDGYFITRTDYLDPDGHLLKQKTLYDLKQTGPESWRAGMVLMENLAEDHRTLLKINRAIFSDEYVPDEVFTFDWLYRNQPPMKSVQAIEAEVDPGLIDPAVEPEGR